jgi:hypothetical protein
MLQSSAADHMAISDLHQSLLMLLLMILLLQTTASSGSTELKGLFEWPGFQSILLHTVHKVKLTHTFYARLSLLGTVKSQLYALLPA